MKDSNMVVVSSSSDCLGIKIMLHMAFFLTVVLLIREINFEQ